MAKQSDDTQLSHLSSSLLMRCGFTVVLLLVGIQLSLTLLSTVDLPCDRLGDFAVIKLEVLNALRGEQQLGPYSRFRFFHPGPISAYAYALPSLLLGPSGTHFRYMELVQLWLNLLLLWAVLHLFTRNHANLLAGLALLGCTFALLPFIDSAVLSDIWGPSRVVVPLIVSLVALAFLGAGQLRSLPLLSLSLCLSLSNHILTAPILLLAAGVSLFLVVLKRKQLPLASARYSILVAILIAVAAFIGPILQAVSNQGGNLLRILSQAEKAAPPHPLSTTFGEMAKYCGFYDTPLLGAVLALLALLLPLLLWKRLSLLQRSWALVHFAAALGCVWSAHSLRGGMLSYLFWPQIAVVISVYALSLWIVAQWCGRLLPTRWRYGTAALVSIAVLAGTALQSQKLSVRPCDDIPWLAPVAEKLRSHLGTAAPVVVGTQTFRDWDTAGLVAGVLAASEIPFCIEPRFRFMYGPDWACTPQRLRQRRKPFALIARKVVEQCAVASLSVGKSRVLVLEPSPDRSAQELLDCLHAVLPKRARGKDTKK